ncbi:hypothetical protein BCR39DRAFT_511129 [Naematelia encephala]|uniref:Uncharacterized protein n=1 Tax=Naematelia encephala TaxID=71784 RepID=A0A1Y2BLH7_9TREE|nr:hypothetical protein BCR39DRAFT_511129 [Naematelia encephala]
MSTPTKFHLLKTRLFAKGSTEGVLPIPRIKAGFKTARGDFPIKTKRKYRPHIERFDWPVTVLGGEDALDQVPMPQIKGVRMRVGDVKVIERKGGLEGMLVSTRPDSLSPFGRKLRTAIFSQLHRLNDSIDWTSATASRDSKLRELESRRREVLQLDAGSRGRKREVGQLGIGSGEADEGVLGIEGSKSPET